MPLIIESYFEPYNIIADRIFPGIEFRYLDAPVSEENNGEELFCYTRKEYADDVKYYFNKIYYVEMGKIVCLHKSARQIKYYDIETGKPIVFEKKEEEMPTVDKTEFLPQLQAQDGDLVLFPEEDDEI